MGRHDERVVSNVRSFIANLPEMLGAMVVDPRCLVAVIEFQDVRYVQYWVGPDGEIVAEVYGSHVVVDVIQINLTTSKLRVKARKDLLPSRTIAQQVYTKIMNQLEQ